MAEHTDPTMNRNPLAVGLSFAALGMALGGAMIPPRRNEYADFTRRALAERDAKPPHKNKAQRLARKRMRRSKGGQ